MNMAVGRWTLFLVGVAVGGACGDDGEGRSSPDDLHDTPHALPPVLTFDPEMIEPQSDGGRPDLSQLRDAGPSRVEDAGEDSGDDPPPPIFEAREPTNTPDAVIAYGGTESSPGMTIQGSNLRIETTGTLTNVEWLGRVRNDFGSTVCAFALGVRLKGAQGQLLVDMDPLADLRPYVDDDGSTTDCAGPGEVFYLHAREQLGSAAAFELEDVRTIEWRYVLGGYLEFYSRANWVSVSGLEVGAGAFVGHGLRGVMENDSGLALQFPSVTAYLLNAGGQPLARLSDVSDQPLASYSSWSFIADSYDDEFPLDSVDTVIGYSVY